MNETTKFVGDELDQDTSEPQKLKKSKVALLMSGSVLLQAVIPIVFVLIIILT